MITEEINPISKRPISAVISWVRQEKISKLALGLSTVQMDPDKKSIGVFTPRLFLIDRRFLYKQGKTYIEQSQVLDS